QCTIAYFQLHGAGGLFVQIGMGSQEAARFVLRRVGEAIDIVVAVAFGMGNAEERRQRRILLHGETGLTGEVLSCDKRRDALAIGKRGARTVEQRLVEALAGLR